MNQEDHQKFERSHLTEIKQGIKDVAREVSEIKTDISEIKAKTFPVAEWFENITFLKKTVMWILSILAAIGGLFLIIKQIFKE